MRFIKIPLALFVLIGTLHADVIVEKINIETTFYGLFNKTRVEVVFHNPTERDSLEGRFSFQTSKSAVVHELWLDIGGELKNAETFWRKTAGRIYDRITRNRIDPALLTKSENGNFYLTVFPVRKKKRRKAVIEYVSLLEDSEFYFRSNLVCKKELTFRGFLPLNTIVIFDGKQKFTISQAHHEEKKSDFSLLEHRLSFADNENINIVFDFSQIDIIPRYVHNNLQFYQLPKNSTDFIILDGNFNAPQSLEEGIESIRRGNRIYFLRENEPGLASDSNVFLKKFLEYLDKIAYVKEIQYQPDSWRWFVGNKKYYMDNRTLLVQNLFDESLVDKIATLDCPLIDLFVKYNENVEKDIRIKNKTGFLYEETAKLVLENDERALQIRQEELKRETDYFNQDYFCASDDPPHPVGGFGAIQRKLIYPEFAFKKKIEGRVILHLSISTSGQVIKTKVIRPLHPVLDILATLAVKQVEWKPAMQRGRPVAVWIAIPVVFHPRTYNKDSRLYERKFTIQEINDGFKFLEDGFKAELARKVKFLSNEFFSILFQNPELIKYPYYIMQASRSFKGMGLVISSPNQFVYIEQELD